MREREGGSVRTAFEKRKKKLITHCLSDCCLVVFRSDTDDSIDLGSLARPFAAAGKQSRRDHLDEGASATFRAAGFWRRARRACWAQCHTRGRRSSHAQDRHESDVSRRLGACPPGVFDPRESHVARAFIITPLSAPSIRLTERSTALFILLRHAQAAAARVAPRNGLSSRRRVATGTVALRAQPRSRTVARSAPYTPLKINAVRHRLVKPIPCEACAFRHARAPGRVGMEHNFSGATEVCRALASAHFPRRERPTLSAHDRSTLASRESRSSLLISGID